MDSQRHFLFLQSVCSPFFQRLADRLSAAGHLVHKINFNGGDAAYWRGYPASSWRRGTELLPAFLEQKMRTLGITDQVLFGDQRPVHKPAVALGKQFGIRTHVFEEGYFRPSWVTLERGGVNTCSRLPRDPEWYRHVGADLPDYGDGVAFDSAFFKRALHDVVYHVACSADWLRFPGYRSHAPVSAAAEYIGFLRRSTKVKTQERIDAAVIARLAVQATPFYFLPLQLNSDAQIREHSSFADMTEVMGFVMASFAAHAPGDARLVIKNHPLEMGASDYPKIIGELQRRHGLAGRVDYLETGDLMLLLKHALGVVTVNSTVGGLSLQFGCPTITLSDPIYNIAGLTFQGRLDDFWRNAIAPDAALFRAFRNTVIHTTQVNGGFYSDAGIALAIDNSMRFLLPDRSPLESLL